MKDITISRRSLLVSAGLLALAPLAGCGGNSGSGSAAAGSDYTIGVLQLTEHSALDAANDGFVKAIKESGLKVKIYQKNAQNDQSTCKSIADKFVGDNVNLIYAIATPAAQAAAGATADIPIVGCAITDYAASEKLLWVRLFNLQNLYQQPWAILLILGILLAIYAICTLLDFIRQALFAVTIDKRRGRWFELLWDKACERKNSQLPPADRFS